MSSPRIRSVLAAPLLQLCLMRGVFQQPVRETTMLRRIRALVNYARVFPSIGDIRAFRRIAYQDGRHPVDIHVREAGASPLHVRPHTSDAAVLWDTFHEKFHLPPCPLPTGATILDLGANVGYTAIHF